jgi:hypothetical protein
MATKTAAAFALVFGVTALGFCPWHDRGSGGQPSTLTACTSGAPLSGRGIPCPIDDR